jgi:hypothetical protein
MGRTAFTDPSACTRVHFTYLTLSALRANYPAHLILDLISLKYLPKTRILNFVVFFILGDAPASEFYVPTFRSTLFHLHRSSCSHRLWRWNRHVVPKRRHIKFRRRESPKRRNTTFTTEQILKSRIVKFAIMLHYVTLCYIFQAHKYSAYHNVLA